MQIGYFGPISDAEIIDFIEGIHASRSSGPISDAEIIDFPRRYPCHVVFLDRYLTLKSLISLDDIHAKLLFWADI